MKGVVRPFQQDVYDQYDSKGKSAMIDFLSKKLPDLQTIENPNQYGIDLLSLNNNDEVILCWEIEVRFGNWKGDIDFPFTEINCIERKDYQWRKTSEFVNKIPFKLNDKCKVAYVQLNDLCTRAVVIDSSIILNYDLKRLIKKKGIVTDEYIRPVPISKTIQIRL